MESKLFILNLLFILNHRKIRKITLNSEQHIILNGGKVILPGYQRQSNKATRDKRKIKSNKCLIAADLTKDRGENFVWNAEVILTFRIVRRQKK